MNPFKRKKEKTFETIDKANIETFLKEISKSVDVTFSGQESAALEQALTKEVQSWLKQTVFSGKKLDPIAIKLGVCLGLREGLRKLNETEEIKKVTYIS